MRRDEPDHHRWSRNLARQRSYNIDARIGHSRKEGHADLRFTAGHQGHGAGPALSELDLRPQLLGNAEFLEGFVDANARSGAIGWVRISDGLGGEQHAL